MTNETVIAILDELKKCYLGGIVDALDFAIEALKAPEEAYREEVVCVEDIEDAPSVQPISVARVMTLKEHNAWTDIPFTERDPVFHEERTKRGSVTCWTNTAVCSSREYGEK